MIADVEDAMGPEGSPADGAGRVLAILLAAGESRRMGAMNKLLLEVEGEPMVRRVARTLLASRLSGIVVVLGHDREAVADALSDLPLETVFNARYRDGQVTSVRAGIAALDGPPADGIMVCLSDQPLLEAGDIDFLIDAFAARHGRSIVVPYFGGARGNPIVFPAAYRRDILEGGMNVGCRHLVDRNPDKVSIVEAPNDHFVRDVDGPGDIQAIAALAPSA